jgi:hypothetical protein
MSDMGRMMSDTGRTTRPSNYFAWGWATSKEGVQMGGCGGRVRVRERGVIIRIIVEDNFRGIEETSICCNSALITGGCHEES